MELITTNNLIIIPVLNCLGFALKASKSIKDNYIPFILIGLGIVLGLFNQYNFNGVLQGILCSAVAMGLYDTGNMVLKEGKRWKIK